MELKKNKTFEDRKYGFYEKSGVTIAGWGIERPFLMIYNASCTEFGREGTFMICFYAGVLNFGPIMLNGTFMQTFETKNLKVFPVDNWYFVTFGEQTKEDCTWVATKIFGDLSEDETQRGWVVFVDDLLVDGQTSFKRPYIFQFFYLNVNVFPKTTFDMIFIKYKEICGIEAFTIGYFLKCNDTKLDFLNNITLLLRIKDT